MNKLTPSTVLAPSLPASAASPSTVELSFRLLVDSVKAKDALKLGHGMQSYPCPIGVLFYETTKAQPPDWANFLDNGAPGIKAKLSGLHSSAMLLIEAGTSGAERLFAITFGQGHHFIERDLIERQFGLRVTLNSITRRDLRTLDSASLDSTVFQRRIQASRESDLVDFGFDSHKELLKLASGRPGDPSIAKAMSGKDALHLRKKIAFTDLPKVCTDLLRWYEAKDYEKDFKFIDQFKPVHKAATLKELDDVVFSELKKLVAGNPSELHLAVPDVLPSGSSSTLSYYGAHLPTKKAHFEELAIEDYVEELRRGSFSSITGIGDFRSTHEVRSQSTAPGEPFGIRKVYDCFVFEATLSATNYVLFDGQWYEISKAYHKEIEDYYSNLLKPSFITSSSAKNERQLIANLNSGPYSNLLCIDQTKISPSGVKGANLEACDFLSNSAQLIHLKDSEDSAPLSHLWNQGLVSAETLRRDSDFRKEFRRVTKDREAKFGRTGFSSQLPARKFDPSKFTVVYAVLKKRGKLSGKLNLPFFSKVALRAAAERISMMGYKVELHLIEKI